MSSSPLKPPSLLRQTLLLAQGHALIGVLFFGLLITSPLIAGSWLDDFIHTQQRVQSNLTESMNATVGVGEGGSGVIVSADGLVLTAAHVSGSPNRRIQCIMPDGRRVAARTLGRFDHADAGMVQLEEEGPWPFVALASQGSVRAGDWCYALGHPGGYQPERGLVLRVGKVIRSRSQLIRSDCELLRGDSGGPLFNLQGQVIGIHSRIGEPMDDNYHAPIDAFHRTWEALKSGEDLQGFREDGQQAYLGVVVEDAEKGFVLQEVRSNSAAERSGLHVGDILLQIDDMPMDDIEALRWAVGSKAPGERVKVLYLRDGIEHEMEIELGPSGRRHRRSL